METHVYTAAMLFTILILLRSWRILFWTYSVQTLLQDIRQLSDVLIDSADIRFCALILKRSECHHNLIQLAFLNFAGRDSNGIADIPNQHSPVFVFLRKALSSI